MFSRVTSSAVLRLATSFTSRSNTFPGVTSFGLRSFSDAVNRGTVKWFDTKKGFGFITPDDGSEDVFVHQTSIYSEGFRSLAEGEQVEFVVQHDPQGRIKALNVTGPKGSYVQGTPPPSSSSRRNSFGDDDFGGGRQKSFGGDRNYGGFGTGGYGGDRKSNRNDNANDSLDSDDFFKLDHSEPKKTE